MGENDKAAKILKTKEFAAFLIEIMNYLGNRYNEKKNHLFEKINEKIFTNANAIDAQLKGIVKKIVGKTGC